MAAPFRMHSGYWQVGQNWPDLPKTPG